LSSKREFTVTEKLMHTLYKLELSDMISISVSGHIVPISRERLKHFYETINTLKEKA
jgi:hypothetical protein